MIQLKDKQYSGEFSEYVIKRETKANKVLKFLFPKYYKNIERINELEREIIDIKWKLNILKHKINN